MAYPIMYSNADSAADSCGFVHEDRENYRAQLVHQVLASLEPVLDRFLKEAAHAGRMEGLEEGMEKGIHLGQIEIARRLMSLGMSIDVVAELTGLREEDIRL